MSYTWKNASRIQTDRDETWKDVSNQSIQEPLMIRDDLENTKLIDVGYQ